MFVPLGSFCKQSRSLPPRVFERAQRRRPALFPMTPWCFADAFCPMSEPVAGRLQAGYSPADLVNLTIYGRAGGS
jgi:hypothetical protein